MSILTGGPEHLYLDQVPAAGPWQTGLEHGLAGLPVEHHPLWAADERASYAQGHIRGTLRRISSEHQNRKNWTPTVRTSP